MDNCLIVDLCRKMEVRVFHAAVLVTPLVCLGLESALNHSCCSLQHNFRKPNLGYSSSSSDVRKLMKKMPGRKYTNMFTVDFE